MDLFCENRAGNCQVNSVFCLVHTPPRQLHWPKANTLFPAVWAFLSFWWNKHIVFVSAGFPPLFPGCPISPASKAVDAGYTSTPSGTRGTVLLCRPGWKREGKNLVVSQSKRPNWGWFNKRASVQHWVYLKVTGVKNCLQYPGWAHQSSGRKQDTCLSRMLSYDDLAALKHYCELVLQWCVYNKCFSVLQSCVSLQAESFSPVYQRR